jgi:hypothetical protein
MYWWGVPLNTVLGGWTVWSGQPLNPLGPPLGFGPSVLFWVFPPGYHSRLIRRAIKPSYTSLSIQGLVVIYGPQQGLVSTTVQSSPNPDWGPRVDDSAIEPDLRHCMLHMFGHGRRKENIILVPYTCILFLFVHLSTSCMDDCIM